MVAQIDDPLRHVAGRVADCLSMSGYAFVEDDKVETLAEVLQTFLTVTGIPVNPANKPPRPVGSEHRARAPFAP
jgi:hypothetical protein